MKKLNLIMPMGGGGTRFGIAGYAVPKPLIEIYGKPFFYWATQSVVKYVDVGSLTFVVLQEHVDDFQIDRKIAAYYPESRIVVIPKILPGAVMTCLAGINEQTLNGPVLFNDCDHLFVCRAFYDYCAKGNPDAMDGALLTFRSSDPRYSYAQCDEKGYVTRTVEKQAVSEDAICGAYYFRDAQVFRRAAETYLHECDYAEFFVSGVYNALARMGAKIRLFSVDSHVSFGTPEEYEAAKSDGTYRLLA